MNNHVVTGSEREATRFALIGIGLVGLAGGAAGRRLKEAKHKNFTNNYNKVWPVVDSKGVCSETYATVPDPQNAKRR